MRQVGTAAVCVGAMAMAGLTAGCRVDTHRNGNGDDKDVKISTPFGGMSVKTDDAAAPAGIGLDVYPGATIEKKEKGHDGSADVNFSFGSFHLGVKAVTYTTPDAPDKVLAFYRQKMAKFGTVILCRHHEPVGTPTRTQDGLTCDDENKHTVHVNVADGDKEELKAGSRQHQHVVGVESQGTGTKFGLVMLDLPMKNDGDDGEDKQ